MKGFTKTRADKIEWYVPFRDCLKLVHLMIWVYWILRCFRYWKCTFFFIFRRNNKPTEELNVELCLVSRFTFIPCSLPDIKQSISSIFSSISLLTWYWSIDIRECYPIITSKSEKVKISCCHKIDFLHLTYINNF